MRERKRGRWMQAAGDVLGGLLGSGRSRAARVGRAAERLTRTSDSKRVDEASGRVERIDRQLAELDRDFADQTATVEAEWAGVAATVTTVPVSLERTDVHVSRLGLAWIPVA